MSGCAVEGGRLYPLIGVGYVVVPTNTATAGRGVTAGGSRVSGLVVGAAGPVSGVAIGHVESLSLSAAPEATGLAEATLSGGGFRLRIEAPSESQNTPSQGGKR